MRVSCVGRIWCCSASCDPIQLSSVWVHGGLCGKAAAIPHSSVVDANVKLGMQRAGRTPFEPPEAKRATLTRRPFSFHASISDRNSLQPLASKEVLVVAA